MWRRRPSIPAVAAASTFARERRPTGPVASATTASSRRQAATCGNGIHTVGLARATQPTSLQPRAMILMYALFSCAPGPQRHNVCRAASRQEATPLACACTLERASTLGVQQSSGPMPSGRCERHGKSRAHTMGHHRCRLDITNHARHIAPVGKTPKTSPATCITDESTEASRSTLSSVAAGHRCLRRTTPKHAHASPCM